MPPAKTPTESSNWLPLLAALMLALAGLVFWDQQSGTAPASREAASAPPSEAIAAKDRGRDAALVSRPGEGLDLGKLHDTVDRPLFEKSRRSPTQAKFEPAPIAKVAPSSPNTGAPTLLGILKSQGQSIVLLKRSQSGQSVRAEEGDTVDGWVVKRIELQHVVLVQGQKEISLRLFRQPPK